MEERRGGLQTLAPVEALRPETRQGDSLQPGMRGTRLSALQAPTAQPLRSVLTSTRPRAHRSALPLGQNARLLPSPGSPQLDTELACCFPHTDAAKTCTASPSQAPGSRRGPHAWSSCNFTDPASHPHTPTSGPPALI